MFYYYVLDHKVTEGLTKLNKAYDMELAFIVFPMYVKKMWLLGHTEKEV